MTWLRLLWLHCCCSCLFLAVSVEGVEKCFLYPVERNAMSLEFLLKESGHTFITVNPIMNPVCSEIKLNNKCLVKLSNEETTTPDNSDCPTLFTEDEYASLVLRRVGRGVGVRLAHTLDDELQVPLSDRGSNLLHVIPSDDVNVAYDCPGGCFQFTNTTIHKSFKAQSGTLRLYGKALRGGGDDNIHLLRGADDWNSKSNLPVSKFKLSAYEWNEFNVSMSITGENHRGTMRAVVTVTSEHIQEIWTNTIPVKSKDLFLRFMTTRNAKWAIFCQPQDTSQTRSSASGETSTSATATTHTQQHTPATISIAFSEREVPLWWAVALAAACGLLLLVTLCLIAFICQRRKQSPLADVLITPQNTPAESTPQNNGDEYEYIDLDKLKESTAWSQVEFREQQNQRESYNSINSVYGCINPVSNDVSN